MFYSSTSCSRRQVVFFRFNIYTCARSFAAERFSLDHTLKYVSRISSKSKCNYQREWKTSILFFFNELSSSRNYVRTQIFLDFCSRVVPDFVRYICQVRSAFEYIIMYTYTYAIISLTLFHISLDELI